jgi:predicted ATPase/DNA-binding SARP family transcriptional activator/Tfp pilus assembly protein PilF
MQVFLSSFGAGMLRLFLFGAPRVEHNQQTVSLRRTKALALLAYLATTRQPQNREALLALLWSEFDTASARNNLRRELSLLKAMLDVDVLTVDRLQVTWRPQKQALDVTTFQAQLALWKQHRHPAGTLCAECAAALDMAVQLYRDDFLAGFSLPESQPFEEWLFFQREELRQQFAEALQALVGWHGPRREHSRAIELARRWLALDPLHEPAQRELMRLYAWAGQHAAGLRQYDECARLLDAELGAEPEPETTKLYEAIKARRLSPPAILASSELSLQQPESLDPEPNTQQPTLKTQNAALPSTTGFVGRQGELADLLRRLTDPDCRLLTLVGPGGIGKTRLALRAAQVLADAWTGEDSLADGVLFVPLAAVETPSGLITALAAAAQFDFYPNIPPEHQVLDHFREKRMLIVLDNFEQLLDTVEFVGELLAAAPNLRLLITSRTALNIQDEWFHPIDGLSFPTAADDVSSVAQLGRFDAIRLFEQHARRVRSDFSLSRVRAPVVRLCQLVEGMPLAIELAAAWLKLLSVEQVVAALERGLDILTARDKQIPQRHRSMRAVLEETWRLLSAEERQIFARLTVFVGGFSAEAAASIASASLNVLATLVDKSLLRSGVDGRFQLHELLRQYAQQRLRESDGEAALAEERHQQFFVDLAEQAQEEMRGSQQQAWVLCLAAENDNLRAVLSRVRAAGDAVTLLRLAGALWQFWNIRSYRSEGRSWLRSALDQSRSLRGDPTVAPLYAQALRGTGTLALNQDDYANAQLSFDASLAEYERIGDVQGVEMALNNLGLVALYQGSLIDARAYFERCLALAPQSGSDWNLDAVTHNLALVLAQQGEIVTARPLFEQSLALSRVRGDVLGILISLVDYASALANHGDYAAAGALADESLALSREAGNAQLMSDALGVLGQIAMLQGDSQRALSLLGQGIELSRNVDEGKSPPLKTLLYLGIALLKEGDISAALDRFSEALAIARSITNGSQVVFALRGLACAAVAGGDAGRAAQLFGASEALSRAQGQALLPAEQELIRPSVQATQAALGGPSFAAAWAAGQELTVEAACALALEIGWQAGGKPGLNERARPASAGVLAAS